jgi:hypothetical protein
LFNSQSEILDMAFWVVSRDNFRRHGALTPKEHFAPAVMRLLQEQFPYHGLTDDSIAQALSLVFAYPASALNHQLIAPLLGEFVLTRRAEPHMQSMLQMGVTTELVEEMHRALTASRVSAVKVEDLAGLGIDAFTEEVRLKTGCGPVDATMGGIRLGEAIGLLGPMKGGKTSLCHSLTCDFIKRDPSHRVTYITYEESTRKQWPKLLISFMNKYHREKLEGKKASEIDLEILPDLKVAHAALVRQLTLVDMSGAQEGQGYGGAGELETTLETLQRNKALGQLVIVDHVLPMVTAHMGMMGLDPSRHMRHQVQAVCEKVKMLVGRLGICIVLAHQMDAAGNRNAMRKPSHMDAAECKLFAQYMHDVLCLGVKCAEDKPIAYLNLSASRSNPEKAIWVRIDGWRCRVEVAGYVLNDRGELVRTDEQELGRQVTDEEHGQLGRPAGTNTASGGTRPSVAAETRDT